MTLPYHITYTCQGKARAFYCATRAEANATMVGLKHNGFSDAMLWINAEAVTDISAALAPAPRYVLTYRTPKACERRDVAFNCKRNAERTARMLIAKGANSLHIADTFTNKFHNLCKLD